MSDTAPRTFYAVSSASNDKPDVFDTVQSARETATIRAKTSPDTNFTIYELQPVGTVRVSTTPITTGSIFPSPTPAPFGSLQPRET